MEIVVVVGSDQDLERASEQQRRRIDGGQKRWMAKSQTDGRGRKKREKDGVRRLAGSGN